MSEPTNKVITLHPTTVDPTEKKEVTHAKTLVLSEEELKFVDSGKEFIKLLEQKQLDVKRIL